jgi:crotonobetainyl-CoA:carnitine CoA-transferase CaiB-like acyl-CoA transferase
MSESSVDLDAPPLLGQHTDEVLAAELGLDDSALTQLRESGVIR